MSGPTRFERGAWYYSIAALGVSLSLYSSAWVSGWKVDFERSVPIVTLFLVQVFFLVSHREAFRGEGRPVVQVTRVRILLARLAILMAGVAVSFQIAYAIRVEGGDSEAEAWSLSAALCSMYVATSLVLFISYGLCMRNVIPFFYRATHRMRSTPFT